MIKITQERLTTFDNPYDPFDDFDNWYLFDKDKGHDSCELLARVSQASDDLSEVENNELNSEAIDSIIVNDPLNIYTKKEKVIEVGV